MFSHPFFLHEPIFDTAVEQAKNAPETAPRFISLARYAHDLLGWFALQPTLDAVKLTCVALPEIEQAPVSIRIRHHFTLTALNGTVPAADDYAIEHLPWPLMGEGVFQLLRQDAVVQRFLALPADVTLEDYHALVYGLALRVDAAFATFQVTHDVGLRSAT